MKISNKFNLGDIVYYPAADLRMSRLIKAPVTGIVVTILDGKERKTFNGDNEFKTF